MTYTQANNFHILVLHATKLQ